eukprot:2963099-Rhodomonas_salina.1
MNVPPDTFKSPAHAVALPEAENWYCSRPVGRSREILHGPTTSVAAPSAYCPESVGHSHAESATPPRMVVSSSTEARPLAMQAYSQPSTSTHPFPAPSDQSEPGASLKATGISPTLAVGDAGTRFAPSVAVFSPGPTSSTMMSWSHGRKRQLTGPEAFTMDPAGRNDEWKDAGNE